MHATQPGSKPGRIDQAHQRPAPHSADLEAARQYRWPGGEHRGEILADLPDTFLKWAEKNTWHMDVAKMCAAVLKYRAREAQTRRIREKLSTGQIDELLHVVFELHERIDVLEARLDRAEVALEHEGYDLDAPKPAGVR